MQLNNETRIVNDHFNDALDVIETLMSDFDQDGTYNPIMRSVVGDIYHSLVKIQHEYVTQEHTGFKSSAVHEYSYAADGIFKIQFTSSDVRYTFKGVPSIVFEEFVVAKSKGKYFADNIRGKYLAGENEYA